MVACTCFGMTLGALFATHCVAWQEGCASKDPVEQPVSVSLLQVAADVQSDGPTYFWAGKNGDALRTGASEYNMNLDTLKAGHAWSFIDGPDGIVRAAPLIDEKLNIYLATVQDKHTHGVGKVRKFSPDGRVLWVYKDNATIPEVPVLYNGVIFFTNRRGVVTALDMKTGNKVWRKSARIQNAVGSGPDTWSMTAGDGVIISAVSSDMQYNNYLVALDAETGEVQWKFEP